MNLTITKPKILLHLSCLLLFGFQLLNAQVKITGQVTGASNEPLFGATIFEKDTSNGTTTDLDGNFTLEVEDATATLVVSYLGYKTQELQASTSPMKITLQENANALNAVVVVGYGTQKKSDIVNAVASVDVDKAVLTPTADVNEMLRGRVAGLQVDVGGGTLRPGGRSELIFRGQGSIEGSVNAIYVVDGIIRDGGIEDIDADDIESIEFLKDASAQAIYGSRGANGVVLITTKRGQAGKVSVNYHGFRTSKTIERNFDVYSGPELADLRREAARATTADDTFVDDTTIFSPFELQSLADGEFVNWEDELVEDGIVDSHNVSLSGGSETTKVFAGINYFRESGLIPTSLYERKTFRLNVDQKISDKLSVNFDLNLLNDDTDRAANVNVITLSPLGRAFNEDGTPTRFPSGEENTAINPIFNLRQQNDEEKGNDFVVNITPIWKITDDLEYQLKTNFTRRTAERGQYLSSLSSAGDDVNGIARINNELRESYLVENILNWDKRINEENKLNVTGLFSLQEFTFTRTFTQGEGFPNESLGYNGITNAIGNVFAERDQNQQRLASFMARLRYTFKNKYLFEGTFRSDGASVNAASEKWSQNAAGSFAWQAHRENFLLGVDEIDELKFRVGYGSAVNDLGIPYTSLFTATGQNYIFDRQSASGYAPSNILPNDKLSFERITTLNVGLDFSIFDTLLFGSVNYYDKRTTDLLLRRGVPPITGFDFTYFNAGELQNTGLELSLTANLINTKDFKWSVSTNWSNNRNELIELYDDGDGNPITQDDEYNYYVGQPIGVIYQYAFDGIFQEGDDFANAPQANPDSTFPQENLRPGDIRIRDTNGLDADGNLTGEPDGKITLEDRVFIDPNPDWFGSLSTTFDYKGFDLFVDFYFVDGATKINPFLNQFNNGATLTGRLNGVKVPYYTPENPSNSFPRPNIDTTPRNLNSLAVSDASYARLRTISLGYTFNENLSSKLGMEQLRVYATATNVFTSTDYIGYSPEVNIRNTFSNADTGYPDASALTFGLRARF